MTDGRPPVPLRIGDETVPTYAFPENAAQALAKIVACAALAFHSRRDCCRG